MDIAELERRIEEKEFMIDTQQKLIKEKFSDMQGLQNKLQETQSEYWELKEQLMKEKYKTTSLTPQT